VHPTSAAALTTFGCATTTVGTISHPVLASTNKKTATRRWAVVSAATAPSFAETRLAAQNCWLGNGARLGGFLFKAIFGLEVLQAGMRGFCGLEATVAAAANVDPTTSTTNAKMGMAINTNTGNWQLIRNAAGVAPTVQDLGASFPVDATTLYAFTLSCAQNGTSVDWTVTNMTTGATASGTWSTLLPSNTTFFASKIWLTNNATAATVQFSAALMETLMP
jgi:hypothetical protein